MTYKAGSGLKFPPGAFPVGDAAEYLGVSEPTIWRMLRDGSLARVRLRGRTVVARAECDALLARAAGPAR